MHSQDYIDYLKYLEATSAMLALFGENAEGLAWTYEEFLAKRKQVNG